MSIYRVSYNKLLQILERGECNAAITELELLRTNGKLDTVSAIEVSYTIDDKGTEHEILTVTEFNVYCENTVYFGVMFKHEADFTIDSARTVPHESYLVLTGDTEVPMPNVDANTKEKLDLLVERALDYCEYADTNEERNEKYYERSRIRRKTMTVRFDYKRNGKVIVYINGRKVPRVFRNSTEAEHFVQSLQEKQS